MRRILCAWVAALLLLAMGAACAEMDLSGMTLEELYAARDAVQKRIDELERQGSGRCYQDGSYKVGVNMPEGDYTLIEKENAMFASVAVQAANVTDYTQRLHKLVSGQAVIHLEAGAKVTLAEITAWPLGAEPSRLGEDGSAGEGGYLVGRQLPAGDYIAQPDEKAPLSSFTIYSDILGTDARMKQFQMLHEAMALTLEEGDYVELSGCVIIPGIL